VTVVALLWGILALIGLFIGLVPCLGSLNWLNIPFSLAGLLVSMLAVSQAPIDRKSGAIAGIVMCAIAALVGVVRLVMGGGIF
jgi:hypothetical protein